MLTRTPLKFLIIAAASSLGAVSASSLDPAAKEAIDKTYQSKGDALATATVTVELEIFVREKPAAIPDGAVQIPKQTHELPVSTVNVSPEGLFLVSQSILDLASQIDGQVQQTPIGKIVLGARSKILETSITFRDGTTLAAETVYQDDRLGLAALRIIKEEQPEEPLDFITFSPEVTPPSLMSKVALFYQLSPPFSRQNGLLTSTYLHQTAAPKEWRLLSANRTAAVVLNSSGQPIGFTIVSPPSSKKSKGINVPSLSVV